MGLSISVLLAQHEKVFAVDIVPSKVEMVNQRKSPINNTEINKINPGSTLEKAERPDAQGRCGHL